MNTANGHDFVADSKVVAAALSCFARHSQTMFDLFNI